MGDRAARLAEVGELLAASLADGRLSRGERQALVARLSGLEADEDRAEVRRRAFALAREVGPAGPELVDWLEAVVGACDRRAAAARAVAEAAEAHFSPGAACPRRIVQLFEQARAAVDVCVFTITDDRLSNALLDAHRRGVAVRVVTDNEKEHDLGSDIDRFRAAGVPVRVDRTSFHMHHKFAVFDAATLLTGSYNWTRGAADSNNENLIVATDPRLLAPFRAAFERLWEALG